MLFDAVVLPDGDEALRALEAVGRTAEFIKDQYRHGKTILALGTSANLLDALGIGAELPNGERDPGLLFDAKRFAAAVARHRHPERDCDPPRV